MRCAVVVEGIKRTDGVKLIYGYQDFNILFKVRLLFHRHTIFAVQSVILVNNTVIHINIAVGSRLSLP